MDTLTKSIAGLDMGEDYFKSIFGGQDPTVFFDNIANVFGQSWESLGGQTHGLANLAASYKKQRQNVSKRHQPLRG